MVYPNQTGVPVQAPPNNGAYMSPIPNTYPQTQQQPDMGSFEWVNNAEEVQGRNPGMYMNRNEPVMYRKAYTETGLSFEVFDLVKREPVQNGGDFVTKDEISAIVAKAVRDELKRSNKKEHNNG